MESNATTVATNATQTANLNENQIAQFMGKVLSINSDLQQNTRGTEYARCVVEFTNAAGQKMTQPAIIYAKNLAHGINVGESYLTTMSIGDNGVAYLQVSHLQGELRAKATDLLSFGITGLRKTTTVVKVVQTAAEARAAIEAQLALI